MAVYKCRCGHPSCNQYTLSDQGSIGFEKDRAILYDAADDLLRALKACGLVLKVMGLTDPDAAELAKQADAAIAKATGEPPA